MEQDAADRPSESFNTSAEDSLVTDTRAQGETVDAGLKEDHKDADGLNPSQPPTEGAFFITSRHVLSADAPE